MSFTATSTFFFGDGDVEDSDEYSAEDDSDKDCQDDSDED